MTFGGMLGAYIVIATNGAAEWRPFDLPLQVWISTSDHSEAASRIISPRTLCSATIGTISRKMLDRDDRSRGGVHLIADPRLARAREPRVLYGRKSVCGLLLHSHRCSRDPCARGDRRARRDSCFGLGTTLRMRARIESIAEPCSFVGWYWHFMGVLWIVLFVLLGFWK